MVRQNYQYEGVPTCEVSSESDATRIKEHKQSRSRNFPLVLESALIATAVLLAGTAVLGVISTDQQQSPPFVVSDYRQAAIASAFPNIPQVLLNALLFLGLEDRFQLNPQPFALESVFGDNMVLQHGSKAAIYGYLGPDCTGVQVDVYQANEHDSEQSLIYSTRDALINATQQPFGKGWGVRPCSKKDCPGKYDMNPFNPWNKPLPTWKVLLPPQRPGGNYTVEVTCLTTTNTKSSSMIMKEGIDPLTITNLTYGDVWYCSGQSNMWLPVYYTFHRNETAKNILYNDMYSNIRIMAGRSQHHPHGDHDWMKPGYGAKGGTNPWMTARMAIDDENVQKSPLFDFGAACWYFGQKLVDQGIDIPIGLANTAIGGQRIQEFMDNSTISTCKNRTKSGGEDHDGLWWEGQLLATQVLPFMDMTIKGMLWYQGENNMYDLKGNSKANLGYGCEMKKLIQGWRRLWSKIPGTTDPDAPFGIVTLASSGSEGGPDMGAMRWAQTANYGVLPHQGDLPNTFIAQAHDLNDEWGPDAGPCFELKCCREKKDYDPDKCSDTKLRDICNARPNGACAASVDTPQFMGGIHPRSKKYVGDRLGLAAYNLLYGGKEAFTGPTLQGCSLENDASILEVRFNSSLMRGDELAEPRIPPPTILPGRWKRPAGGSQLYVQTKASQFCMEEKVVYDGFGTKQVRYYCPDWAGGTKEQQMIPIDKPYQEGWIQLNFTKHNSNTIHVDLSPLNGSAPTAIRYAWGIIDCCDHTDPALFVTHPCIANCPIQAKSGLPANPFKARIDDGKCKCIAPQICSD